MAALLQGLLAKGLASQEALPTIKALVEAKVFSLDQLTTANMPGSISKKIQAKILKKNRNKGQSTASRKKQKTTPIVVPEVSPESTQKGKILINRSPILTLWASVVAKKLYCLTLEEALTFGSAYAAECARAKGTSLGIYRDKPKAESTGDLTKGNFESFALMNQTIQAIRAANGLRAIGNGTEQDPHSIWKSLTKKLGHDLSFVLKKMEEAAELAGDNLEGSAYNYYMHVRPDIPQGTKGWGAHGYMEISKLSDFYPGNQTGKTACR